MSNCCSHGALLLISLSGFSNRNLAARFLQGLIREPKKKKGKRALLGNLDDKDLDRDPLVAMLNVKRGCLLLNRGKILSVEDKHRCVLELQHGRGKS